MFNCAEFRWTAYNRQQQKQKGKLIAVSHEAAEAKLLQQGFHTIRLHRNFALVRRPKQAEITQLLAQFSLLLNAHIPLKSALTLLLETCQHIALYRWLWQIQHHILAGFAFSAALAQLPRADQYLRPQEIQLIKMGEISGNLAVIIHNMVLTRQKAEKLAQKIKKILFYPVIVLTISLGLSLFLLLTIVPQFAELYLGKSKTLPFITEILFALSQWLERYISLSLPLLLGTLLLFLFWAKRKGKLAQIQFCLLSHLPIFRTILAKSRLVFFCQNCALMLNAHLRLDRVIQSFFTEQLDDHRLQQSLQHTHQQLQQGYPFYQSLSPVLFPEEMRQLIQIGEKTGQLATMLTHCADIYQQQLDYQIELLSQLLEPMLMLIMGAIVGTIIVGLYLPIFDLGGLVE